MYLLNENMRKKNKYRVKKGIMTNRVAKDLLMKHINDHNIA